MERVRQAKRNFTATCGHVISPGHKYLVVEERPKFYCPDCAKKFLAEKLNEKVKEILEK